LTESEQEKLQSLDISSQAEEEIAEEHLLSNGIAILIISDNAYAEDHVENGTDTVEIIHQDDGNGGGVHSEDDAQESRFDLLQSFSSNSSRRGIAESQTLDHEEEFPASDGRHFVGHDVL